MRLTNLLRSLPVGKTLNESKDRIVSARLKQIGTRAREQIEKLLGCKVFLQLHVKVEKDWTQTARGLRRAGYPEGR